MKKILIIFTVLILLIIPCGCNNTYNKNTVCVTMYPLYDFTQKIAGDKINVQNLAPSGDLHHYTPTLSDMNIITNSKLLIYNGAGLEQWIDDIIDSLDNNIKILEASKDVQLLDSNNIPITENTEQHNIDPHIWLYPLNAKKMAENIKNALIEIDNENADYYNQNYQNLSAEFDKLNSEYMQALQNPQIDTIVVAHKAFGYLCYEYGLNQVAALNENANGETSPDVMIDLINIINNEGIKVVFYEEQSGDKLAQSLVEQSNAEIILPLNPMPSITNTQLQNGDDYFSIMRENLINLTQAVFYE